MPESAGVAGALGMTGMRGSGLKVMRWAAAVVMATGLAACASTQFTSVWRSPDDSGVPIARVAVFVLNPDDNLRRFAEDQAVRSVVTIGRGGVRASPSYRLFEKPEQDIDRVKARLSSEGFDAILMARTISSDRTQHYVPPQTVPVPTPMMIGPLRDPKTLDVYYPMIWGMTYQTTPGYVADTTRIVTETVLYRLPGGEPIWSGVTETRDPLSKADMVQDLVRLIGQRLSEDRLLAGGDVRR